MILPQSQGFLNTPPLWDGIQLDVQQFEFPNVNLDTYQPKDIIGNFRLGHQMEFAFKQLIEHSDRYDILIHNLPIRQERRTLGEIDFILNDKPKNKLIHVELTYKFYVIDPELTTTQASDPYQSIIGPNRRDSFLLKMEKIKNKQFPLLHSEEAAKSLSAINIDHSKIEHQCCFKAQLFNPYGSTLINIGSLNKKCLTGYWVRFDDFKRDDFPNAKYYIPSKSEWPIEPHDQVILQAHDKTLRDVDLSMTHQRAPMVWKKKATGEFEKLFIVWW